MNRILLIAILFFFPFGNFLRGEDELKKLKKEKERLLRENRELKLKLRILRYTLRSYQRRLRQAEPLPKELSKRLKYLFDSFLRELGRETYKKLRTWLPPRFRPYLEKLRKMVEKPSDQVKPTPVPRVSPRRMAQIYYQRGLTFMREKKYSEAAKAFTKAIRFLPNHPGLYFLRGNAYLMQKQFQLAEKDYLQAIRLNPKYAVAQYNLACTYALQGKKEKALHWLSLAIRNGFNDFEHIAKDPDLKSLRKDPRFQKLLKKRWK